MKGWRIATQWSGSAEVFDRNPVFVPELILDSLKVLSGRVEAS
jgi:hypothetical protein